MFSLVKFRTDEKLAVSISPTAPLYFKYNFAAENEIQIQIKSEDNLCTSISVQSFDCPVYDIDDIGFYEGRYQTLSVQTAMNVYVNNR